jgi:hypothetical protein
MTSSIVSTEYVNLTINDGTQMQAYVARPKVKASLRGSWCFRKHSA